MRLWESGYRDPVLSAELQRARIDYPLNAEIGSARRYATADTELDDYKAIRKAHGGKVPQVFDPFAGSGTTVSRPAYESSGPA